MKACGIFMKFPQPCVKVKFLHRPQRFLAEISFADGTKTIAYCANPGSFAGCLNKGSAALLWDSNNYTRKRRYTLRAVKVGRVWVGTDTHLSNRIVEKALQLQIFSSLQGYPSLTREHPFGKGQRVDFLLAGPKGLCFLEVKSASIMDGGVARFPDSVTPRGLNHLTRLTEQAKKGHRAVILFMVQRGDATSFSINSLRHPAYAKAFRQALKAGVEAMAFAVTITPKGFSSPVALPFCEEAVFERPRVHVQNISNK